MVRHTIANDRVPSPTTTTWFTPYVDATLPPLYPFGDTRYNPAGSAVLGFVVADREDPCTPTWGTWFDLDEADEGVDLDRRIETLRRRGGELIVSFGGAINDELAVSCTDVDDLTEAYTAVVDRYDLGIIDLDLEGPGLTDVDARTRRAEAIAAVQDVEDDGLDVWLTLPADRSGLTADGMATVQAFLDAGVELAGVNVMTMNFGSLTAGDQVADAIEQSLQATAEQVRRTFGAAGYDLADGEEWAHVGGTVMIGRNDVITEVLTLADAEQVASFALEHGLGRLSMWSLNRDAPCGPEVDAGVAQSSCSSVVQKSLDFARLFAGQLDSAPPDGVEIPVGQSRSQSAVVVDDPATSPYPIWTPTGVYRAGDKVVLDGNVYQAKWWAGGAQPGVAVANPWDTPWSLVGPVLPSDVATTTTTLPPGVFREWQPQDTYEAGSRVQHLGVAYEAKWWTTGDEPGIAGTDPRQTPWAPIVVDLDQLYPSATDVPATDDGSAATTPQTATPQTTSDSTRTTDV